MQVFSSRVVVPTLVSAAVVAVAAGLGGCAPPVEEPEVLSIQSGGACAFSVTKNTYSGRDWWGTITFRNDGSSASSSFEVRFDVPSGVTCDYAEAGWTYAQDGVTCIYTKPGATLAAGASMTMHYSTNSQAFSAASNVAVTDAACGGAACAPESDAELCARLGASCGGVSATDNCGAGRTVASCGSCTAPETCGGGGTANVCGATTTDGCAFTVTQNAYDGSQWWGTIAFRNDGPSASSSFEVRFDVPSGASCDYAEAGWSYSQDGVTCRYSKPGATLAAGASLTMHYSTSSQAFSAASNVTVTDATCGDASTPPPTTPPPTTPPPSGDGLTWRQANLTNFESYPDPGSDECVLYNGCTWAGQFAFVSGTQPESWVMSHNIIAVHSKDAGAYGLKTLRLRQGTNQIDAVVYDMCADSDCDGCCTANSAETGFLIDIEKYTMDRFGSGDGIVEWACLDCD